nr:MFS transporter [Plastoroseomonas hellenica]
MTRHLAAYLLLYGALYCGWGVLSPFLPAVLAWQGASPGEIGLLLAAGMVARLASIPAAGLVADRHNATRQVLAGLLAAAAMLGIGFVFAQGAGALLLVTILHAMATGPLGPLPDALAVSAAREGVRRSFDYGWVRGAGALSFVAGNVLAGLAVTEAGFPHIVLWINAGLFAVTAGVVFLLPHTDGGDRSPQDRAPATASGTAIVARLGALLGLPSFRWLLIAAGLISCSHAFYAGFATLRWQAAGIAPGTIGFLWAIAVGSEVLVFLVIGRRLLTLLGPAGVTALAAGAGVLRWTIMAVTTWQPAMMLVQPLHGLTFAAQHLAAMAIIARVVPSHLAATAQTLYAALGVGVLSAAVTLASGALYERYGGQGFWPMAVLCAAAVPAAFVLRTGLRRHGATNPSL